MRPFVVALPVSYLLVGATNIVICIDRLICILKPFTYYGLTARYTKITSVCVLLFGLGCTVCFLIFAVTTSDLTAKTHVLCSPLLLGAVLLFVRFADAIACIITVVLVVVMVTLFLTVEKSKAAKKFDGIQSEALRRNRHVTRMLMYVLGTSIFLSCLPSLGLSYLVITGTHNFIIGQLCNILNVVNSMNNIAFYMWKNQLFGFASAQATVSSVARNNMSGMK